MEKSALLFSGQGSQYLGMADSICKKYKVAEKVFEEASEVLSIDLRELCNNSNEEITLTYNAQPLILTTSIAMYRAFVEEIEEEPAIFAGHSLGEISALTAANAISLHDAVKIARKRGKFMQQVVADHDGAMLAIQCRDVKKIDDMCKTVDPSLGSVEIANYNSKVQTVISGESAAVHQIEMQLAEEKIKTTKLSVSAPFHSIYMKPAAMLLQEELSKYEFRKPEIPVLSATKGNIYETAEEIPQVLTKQVYQPIDWVGAMKNIYAYNVTYGVQIGPGKVLKNLMKKNISNIPVFAFEDGKDVKSLKKYIEKGHIPFLSRCLGIAVATRNFNMNEEEYNNGVIQPYKKIKLLEEKVEAEGRKATKAEMDEAIEMLCSVFKTKGTSIEEQERRFDALFKETGTKSEYKDFTLFHQ